MNTDPSQIREQIDLTRAHLSSDVDALADKANPAHIAQRQMSRVKAAGSRLLDRVLGVADEAKDQLTEGMDQVAGLPQAARRQTQGNPLAAGAVAFGLGLLVAAAIPPSRKEAELATTVKEQAQPLTEQVTEAAREVADSLAEPAQEAAGAVRRAATEAGDRLKTEGFDAADELRRVADE